MTFPEAIKAITASDKRIAKLELKNGAVIRLRTQQGVAAFSEGLEIGMSVNGKVWEGFASRTVERGGKRYSSACMLTDKMLLSKKWEIIEVKAKRGAK